jgi:hypothetical protein
VKFSEILKRPKLTVRRSGLAEMFESKTLPRQLEESGWIRPCWSDGITDFFSVEELEAATRRLTKEQLPYGRESPLISSGRVRRPWPQELREI